jgi:hypothetical protein
MADFYRAATSNELLFVLPSEGDGDETVQYFTDEAALDAAVTEQYIRDARALAGAWSDLDWDEMEAALLLQRREVPPTRPYCEE